MWLVASVLSLIAALVPSVAAASPPELGQENIMTASYVGYKMVTLPKDVYLRRDEERVSYTFEGDGRLLMGELRSEQKVPGTALAEGVVSWIRKRGCTRPGSCWTGSRQLNSAYLPAGKYRFYFISDAPGRLTLSFPTLKGKTELEPDQRVPFEFGPPRFIDNIGGYQRFGETRTYPGGGIVVFQAVPAVDAPSPLYMDVCYYAGQTGEAATAYLPQCPGGRFVQGSYHPLGAGAADIEQAEVFFGGGTATYGVGGIALSAVGQDIWRAWMAYDDPAAAAEPSPLPGSGEEGASDGDVPDSPPAAGPETNSPGEDPEPQTPGAPLPDERSTGRSPRQMEMLALTDSTVDVDGRYATPEFECSGDFRCRGTVTLWGKRKRYSREAGSRGVIRIYVKGERRWRLRRRGRLTAALIVRQGHSDGSESQQRYRVQVSR